MQGAFLPEWIGAGIALAVLFAFSYIQIRHFGLAAAAALAPLPGYLLAVALHASSQPLGYVCGFAVANILLSVMETQICDGASPANATREAIRSVGAALFWSLTLVSAAMAIFSAMGGGVAALMASLTVLLCGLSALAITVLMARFFAYDDEFIARANRLRERRERWLDGLAFVVQPRWGWSVSGVALIFAVLGIFGGQDSGATWPFPVLSAEGVLFAVLAYAATRNMRRTIAVLLTVAILACLASWVRARLAIGGQELVLAIAVGAAPALIMAIQSARFARGGDAVAVSGLRATEQLAIPIVFFSAASSIALLPLGAFAGAILIALGGMAALIVFAALTTAIHDLFPPRVSLDAYRIR